MQELLREMADAGCTHVVMEASSHALVLHRLDGIPFRAGIFTNLTQDHLDFHGTMEAYRDAKGLLFRQCAAAVLNLDDEAAGTMPKRCRFRPLLTRSAGTRRISRPRTSACSLSG